MSTTSSAFPVACGPLPPPMGYQFGAPPEVFGRRTMFHARPEKLEASGGRSYFSVNSAMTVCVANIRYPSPTVEWMNADDDVIKVHVRLTGESMVGFGKDAGVPVHAMSCAALIHQRGNEKYESFVDDGVQRSVTVACRPDYLADELGVERLPCPRTILAFLDGKRGVASGFDLPLQLDTRRAAEALFDDFALGSSRALLIESRALELLARFFDQATVAEGGPPQVLRTRDRHLAEAAQRLLDERLQKPPSLKALASEVGTHQGKLMRVFKAAHGMTISDYVETARMGKAKRLLTQAEMSVSEIAFEVGYEHPGNFATAFRRCFGLSPSEVANVRRSGVR